MAKMETRASRQKLSIQKKKKKAPKNVSNSRRKQNPKNGEDQKWSIGKRKKKAPKNVSNSRRKQNPKNGEDLGGCKKPISQQEEEDIDEIFDPRFTRDPEISGILPDFIDLPPLLLEEIEKDKISGRKSRFLIKPTGIVFFGGTASEDEDEDEVGRRSPAVSVTPEEVSSPKSECYSPSIYLSP